MGFAQSYFVTDYSQMCDVLTRELIRRDRRRSLVVAVFASARDQFTQAHILPHVAYWNCRSEDWVDFFFPGYLGSHVSADDEYGTIGPDDDDEAFVEKHFVAAIKDFEAKYGWDYSGEPSVLIFQAVLEPQASSGKLRASPDLSYFMQFDLAAAIKDEAITSVRNLFERIIRFARTNVARDPDWDLARVLADEPKWHAIVDAIFENMPIKGVKKVLLPFKYFSVQRGIQSRHRP